MVTPTGTSSSSPTYYQSDSTASYTVSGTASDDSGISKVTVNGNVAELNGSSFNFTLSLATNTTHTITVVVTDGAGNQNTITRYVRIEAYYQQAARIAGTTIQTSLANTLTNTTVCTAIAGNSTACSIMKAHYASDINSYNCNTTHFNDSLNLLAYKVGGSRVYLHRVVNNTTVYNCNNIHGGWYQPSDVVTLNGANDNNNTKGIRFRYGDGGKSWISTNNRCVNGSQFTSMSITVVWNGPGTASFGVGTTAKSSTWNPYKGGCTEYGTFTTPSMNASTTYYAGVACTARDVVVSEVYLNPR